MNLSESLTESAPSLPCDVRIVKSSRQITEPLLELRDAHPRRLKIHVKQRASLPGPVMEDASFASKPLVERGARPDTLRTLTPAMTSVRVERKGFLRLSAADGRYRVTP